MYFKRTARSQSNAASMSSDGARTCRETDDRAAPAGPPGAPPNRANVLAALRQAAAKPGDKDEPDHKVAVPGAEHFATKRERRRSTVLRATLQELVEDEPPPGSPIFSPHHITNITFLTEVETTPRPPENDRPKGARTLDARLKRVLDRKAIVRHHPVERTLNEKLKKLHVDGDARIEFYERLREIKASRPSPPDPPSRPPTPPFHEPVDDRVDRCRARRLQMLEDRAARVLAAYGSAARVFFFSDIIRGGQARGSPRVDRTNLVAAATTRDPSFETLTSKNPSILARRWRSPAGTSGSEDGSCGPPSSDEPRAKGRDRGSLGSRWPPRRSASTTRCRERDARASRTNGGPRVAYRRSGARRRCWTAAGNRAAYPFALVFAKLENSPAFSLFARPRRAARRDAASRPSGRRYRESERRARAGRRYRAAGRRYRESARRITRIVSEKRQGMLAARRRNAIQLIRDFLEEMGRSQKHIRRVIKNLLRADARGGTQTSRCVVLCAPRGASRFLHASATFRRVSERAVGSRAGDATNPALLALLRDVLPASMPSVKRRLAL